MNLLTHTPKSSIPSTFLAAFPRYIQILQDPNATTKQKEAAQEIIYGLCDLADSHSIPENMMHDSQSLLFKLA